MRGVHDSDHFSCCEVGKIIHTKLRTTHKKSSDVQNWQLAVVSSTKLWFLVPPGRATAATISKASGADFLPAVLLSDRSCGSSLSYIGSLHNDML